MLVRLPIERIATKPHICRLSPSAPPRLDAARLQAAYPPLADADGLLPQRTRDARHNTNVCWNLNWMEMGFVHYGRRAITAVMFLASASQYLFYMSTYESLFKVELSSYKRRKNCWVIHLKSSVHLEPQSNFVFFNHNLQVLWGTSIIRRGHKKVQSTVKQSLAVET